MFWKKIWKKKEPGWMSGPKEIPELVGRFLVVKLKKDPDWVWKQRGVVRLKSKTKEDRKLKTIDSELYECRVFDEGKAIAKKVAVKNYTSLDAHPDLIMYEGTFDKKTLDTEMKEGKAAP